MEEESEQIDEENQKGAKKQIATWNKRTVGFFFCIFYSVFLNEIYDKTVF